MDEKLLLTRAVSARALSMSLRHFMRVVLPHVRVVRAGRCVLVPVSELNRWIAENMDL